MYRNKKLNPPPHTSTHNCNTRNGACMLKPTGSQKPLMLGLKYFQALPVKVKNIDMYSKFKTELKSYLRKKPWFAQQNI